MKLISLNIWGGRIHEPFIEFVKKHSQDVDVFCLQEVFDNKLTEKSQWQKEARENIYSEIKSILNDYHSFIHPRQYNEESNALFVKNTINIKEVGEAFLYGSRNSMVTDDYDTFPVNMEYLSLTNENGKEFIICNLHGYWTHDGKKDNPRRLEQSKKIIEFLKQYNCAKIVCGDFNLLPDTQSIKILENNGLRNLIKEYNIISTRSHYYKKENKFADYSFVSTDVKVNEFKILQDEISDHLPLYLEFK